MTDFLKISMLSRIRVASVDDKDILRLTTNGLDGNHIFVRQFIDIFFYFPLTHPTIIYYYEYTFNVINNVFFNLDNFS